MTSEEGKRVMWRGHGLGTVRGVVDGMVRVEMDTGTQLTVPPDKVEALASPLPSPEVASQLRARLLDPAPGDPRDWQSRYLDFHFTRQYGSLEDLVDLTRRVMATGPAESMGERRVRLALEDGPIAAIAEALDLDPYELAREAEAAQQAATLTPREPDNPHIPPEPNLGRNDPDAPRPESAQYLGTFEAGGALVVSDPIYAGRNGKDAAVVVAAPAAAWHCYIEPDDPDEPVEAVFALRVGSGLSLGGARQAARTEGKIWVDGGMASILRAENRDDRYIVDHFGVLVPTCTVLDYGVCVDAGDGDGTYRVSVAADERGPAYVRVDFYEPDEGG